MVKQEIGKDQLIEASCEPSGMLQKLSEQIPGVIYQYQLFPDGGSCFPYASDAIRQIYEVTPEQVRHSSAPIVAILHPEDSDRVMASIQQSFDRLELWHEEYRVVLPQRGLRWLEGHAMPEKLPDGSVLWHGYIWDITDRKQLEIAQKQKTDREQLLRSITDHIHQSLNLDTILATAVAEVQQVLLAERALIFQLYPDGAGQIIQESVVPGYPVTRNMRWLEECFPAACYAYYCQGKPRIIPDVAIDEWADCLVNFMQESGVKSKIVAPIVQSIDNASHRLWGLLIVHSCSCYRDWQLEEADLLQQIANQLAIAIHQSELYQQVQQLNINLENQVKERTAQLEKSLNLEATLKRITDAVRDSLDEYQILQTAVRELSLALDLSCCDTALYDREHQTSTICCEYNRIIAPVEGQTIDWQTYPELHAQSLLGFPFQFCPTVNDENLLRPLSRQVTILVCPLVDEQSAIGDMWLFKSCNAFFGEIEIRLAQQVANQCIIGMRQARLYQSAQTQVTELERLNHLKDDFLNTVSHELRTPMSNIKMATQMLEITLRDMGALNSESNNVNRYFQILKDEGQREINLINNLLDLSRLDAGTEPLMAIDVDLQTYLPHIAEPFIERTRNHQQQLQVEIAHNIPHVHTDIGYLERILAELLNNACKYTPAGESIRLTGELAISENEILIRVTNTGIEIPAQEHDRVFEKFYRIPSNDPWKHGGTGLGLALVRKLAEKLNGTIELSSSSGQTCFTLHLPVV